LEFLYAAALAYERIADRTRETAPHQPQ